jgi:Na+-transporting NADH:ubiquinone oxidoreductase subunit C
MNVESNKYIFLYSAIMVVLVAVSLTIVAIKLKPAQEKNIRVEKMQNILKSVNIATTVKDAEDKFKQYITEKFIVNLKGEKVEGAEAFDVDMALELKKDPDARNLPVFVCTKENGEKDFIVPLRGKGLWGPIWGFISFSDDFNTIVGCMFDHKGETPGLGAEINTDKFQSQFASKKIFDDNNKFTSISIVKGGAAPDDIHGVDAISGGTITSKGVQYMIRDCLTQYEPFFKTQKDSKK